VHHGSQEVTAMPVIDIPDPLPPAIIPDREVIEFLIELHLQEFRDGSLVACDRRADGVEIVAKRQREPGLLCSARPGRASPKGG
jgi:hypothetical protein